jgi:hypothetical protein
MVFASAITEHVNTRRRRVQLAQILSAQFNGSPWDIMDATLRERNSSWLAFDDQTVMIAEGRGCEDEESSTHRPS